MKKIIGILILYLSMPIFLLSQNWSDADSIAYDKLTTAAEESFYEGVKIAIENYNLAAHAALKYKRYYEYIYLLERKTEAAVYHFEYDSAFHFLIVQDSIFSQIEPLLDSTEQYILPRHYTNWLYYYNRIGDDQKVMLRSKSLIRKIENGFGGVYGPYHLTVAQNYLAVALKRLGRLEEAENVAQKGILTCIELEDPVQENSFKKQLGDIAALKNNPLLSNQYYNQILPFYKSEFKRNQKHASASRIISIYQAISNNYLVLGKSDSAKYSIGLIEPILKVDSFLFVPYQLQMADFDIQNNELDQALNKLELAQNFGSSSAKINPNKSAILLKKAKIFRLKGDTKMAMEYNEIGISENTLNDQIINVTDGIELFRQKGQLLQESNLSDGNNLALNEYEKIRNLLSMLRLTASTDEDRSYLISSSKITYAEAIQLLIESNSPKKDKIALHYFEEMKAINLLGAIRELSDISIDRMSASNQKMVASLKKEWEDSKDLRDGINGRDLKEIISIREKYFLKLENLQAEEPNYFANRYKIQEDLFPKLSKKLKEEEMGLISYFWSDKFLFGLYVDEKNTQLFNCGTTEEIDSLLSKLLPTLSNPKKLFDVNSSKDLFSILIEKINFPIKGNLLIIPDGPLFHLPFEVLISSENMYLLDLNNISYSYSASIWETLKSSVRTKSVKYEVDDNATLLAYAPSFQNQNLLAVNTRENLSPLTFNNTEINNIQQFVKSTLISGDQATKSSFLEKAPYYKRIHLATHAMAYDDQPGQSFLAFSGASSGADTAKLFLSDIYSIRLNAELVTLSACETGLGPIKAGEGVVSLASAFQYAGAKSLVTSLWNVNDETTSKIMTSFYEHLANGDSKSVALRKAKKTHLQQLNKTLLHPAYWAGFVLYGDERPVENNSIDLYWWLLGGLVVFLLGVFIWKRGHNKIDKINK